MVIPGFNILSTKYYNFSRDIKPIAFSCISDDNATIIICFRGSQTSIDFIDDTKYNYYNPVNGVLPVESNPETKVYTSPGCTSIYTEKGVRGDILSNIDTHIKNNPNKLSRIFICGHSLGGGLSFLLANELGGLYTNIVEVYGIAPLKIGDNPFSNSVQNNCKYALSLINLADTVPSSITTYMHNKNNPKNPCSFSHIEPIAIFNNIKSNAQDCHLIDAYYQGVIIGNPGVVSNIIIS
jgi:predicted lipase